MLTATSIETQITTVSTNATHRLRKYVLVSVINDDLLKACINLLTPFVAKNSVVKNPKENNPPLFFLTT
jgi:hypothetical protein